MAQITIVDKPGGAPVSAQPSETNAQQSARARAIAALSGGTANQAQATPVANPSSVAVEDMAAISQSSGQNDSSAEATNASEPEVTAPTKEEPLSSQYAALARKEKAIRAKAMAQEAQFKQREAALQAREAEIQSKSSIDSSKYISIDDLKRDAYSTLMGLGITYDELSQQALNAQSPEAQAFQRYKAMMDKELQQVREEQAKTRQSFEQQQAQAYQQALAQIKNEANQLVNSDPSFETIKATGSVDDVVELIERTFQQEGTLLTVEQAAQAVEDYLIEEALKIANIKKIQAKLKPAAQQPAPQKQPTQPAQPAQMKTLTNAVGSTRPLTAKERALLAFKGELNDNKK
jgi:hypothetical protein